jgi:hypothetical protein
VERLFFAVPYGLEYFVAVFQFVGTAERVHQLVEDCLFGLAGRVDQDAVVNKSFGKSHIVKPLVLFNLIF